MKQIALPTAITYKISIAGLQMGKPPYINNEFNTSNKRRNAWTMPDTDLERFQLLIQRLQKFANFSRTCPETASLTMNPIKILNFGQQRLWGDLSSGIECLPLLGGEVVDMPLNC